MLTRPAAPGRGLARGRLARLADALVAAIAVSLPWSTAATSILTVLWLIALLPALDTTAVRRELMSAAGGLPVLLWVLGALGMLWADVSWSERMEGLSGFHKLLMIPLLLAQFRHSENGLWVLVGFLVSSAVLLLFSWSLVCRGSSGGANNSLAFRSRITSCRARSSWSAPSD